MRLLEQRRWLRLDIADPFPAIGSGEKFAGIDGDIWRWCMIAPSDAPRVARELNATHWLGDLAGGLIWLARLPPTRRASARSPHRCRGGDAVAC